MQPFRVLSHSTWLAPLILETVGFTYGIIIIQCQCRARNAAGVQSLLFHVSLGLLQLFSQLNLSVRVSVCVAQKGNKDMDSIPPPPPFAKEIKKREKEQLKANLISTPELNPDGMSRLDQFLFLDLFFFPPFFLFNKKLLLTRSTGTIDPSLSFLYDCLQPFLVVVDPPFCFRLAIDMLRTLSSPVIIS
jgi:hypothetical protein